MKKEAVIMLLVAMLTFFTLNISAKPVQDDINLNIKAKNSTGAVKTGTFDFVFNISDSETNTCDSSNIVYSDTTTLTTDSEGVVSYYLEDVSLNYSKQHWLCHYRDGTLQDTTKIASSPRALSVDSGDVQPDGALNLTGVTGFFEFLGSVTNRITTLFVQDINATGTVTADSFETTGGGSIGSGTYVGKTSSRHKGGVGSYSDANDLCDSAHSGSHVCTFGELKETMETQNVSEISSWQGTAWIAGGAPGFTAESNDCSGFTSNSSSGVYGRVWNFDIDSSATGKGVLNVCSSSNFFACCK